LNLVGIAAGKGGSATRKTHMASCWPIGYYLRFTPQPQPQNSGHLHGEYRDYLHARMNASYCETRSRMSYCTSLVGLEVGQLPAPWTSPSFVAGNILRSSNTSFIALIFCDSIIVRIQATVRASKWFLNHQFRSQMSRFSASLLQTSAFLQV